MGLLSKLFRMGRKAAPVVDDAVPPLTPPPREIGAGGLPIRPGEPFKRSFQGGSEDLMAAARMIRPEDWPQFMALLSSGVSMTAALEMMERRA